MKAKNAVAGTRVKIKNGVDTKWYSTTQSRITALSVGAKVAIDTYRNYIFAPTDNAVILDQVVLS